MMMEAGGLGDGRKEPQAKECRRPPEARKSQRNRMAPRASRKNQS